jgi:type IV pilus modification protein PilV
MNTSSKRPKGFSLVELMIAVFILAVGLLACMTLLLVGMSGNSRNRNDAAATMLAQKVIEQINTMQVNSGVAITMTDCNGTAWSVNTASGGAGNSSGAGADLDALTGGIDFTQSKTSVPAGYQMNYVACASKQDRESTYDVRWNIKYVSANTNLLTVSAREVFAPGRGGVLYAPPVILRTIQGR